MSHLFTEEVIKSIDSFFIVLYGLENVEKWKLLKNKVGCSSEIEFVSWMLNGAEVHYENSICSKTNIHRFEKSETATSNEGRMVFKQEIDNDNECLNDPESNDHCVEENNMSEMKQEAVPVEDSEHAESVDNISALQTFAENMVGVGVDNMYIADTTHQQQKGRYEGCASFIPKRIKTSVFPCSLCGKTFHSRQYAEQHHRMIHGNDEHNSWYQEHGKNLRNRLNQDLASYSNELETSNEQHSFISETENYSSSLEEGNNMDLEDVMNEEDGVDVEGAVSSDMAVGSDYLVEEGASYVERRGRRHRSKSVPLADSYIKMPSVEGCPAQYQCSVCGKVFSQTSTVMRHVRDIHYKMRNHVCDQCGKKFARRTARDHHLAQCGAANASVTCAK